MNLNTHAPTPAPRVNLNTAPRIALVYNRGRLSELRLNASLVRQLGLTPGGLVAFHQDIDYPEDWYIEAVDQRGWRTTARKGDNSLRVYSVEACRLIDGLACGAGSVAVARVATELGGRRMFGLLIARRP